MDPLNPSWAPKIPTWWDSSKANGAGNHGNWPLQKCFFFFFFRTLAVRRRTKKPGMYWTVHISSYLHVRSFTCLAIQRYVLCDLYIMLQAFREFSIPFNFPKNKVNVLPKMLIRCAFLLHKCLLKLSGSLNQNPKIIDIFSYDSYMALKPVFNGNSSYNWLAITYIYIYHYNTQMLHVWYIYLHLPQKLSKCR